MSDFDNPEIKISDYSAISYLQISFMIYFDEILGWDVIVYRGPIIYYIHFTCANLVHSGMSVSLS